MEREGRMVEFNSLIMLGGISIRDKSGWLLATGG